MNYVLLINTITIRDTLILIDFEIFSEQINHGITFFAHHTSNTVFSSSSQYKSSLKLKLTSTILINLQGKCKYITFNLIKKNNTISRIL